MCAAKIYFPKICCGILKSYNVRIFYVVLWEKPKLNGELGIRECFA